MKYITIWHTNGTFEKVEQPEPVTLEELQNYVGGFIEVVRLDNGHLLIINEEGKLKGLPINPHNFPVNLYGDVIVGEAVEVAENKDGDLIGF